MMSEKSSMEADLEALNRFVVECEDLHLLETLLARFNLFRVLKFEYGEIRHSNVLAWIFDPAESHGLGAAFLQKWLMRILHECDAPPIPAAVVATWNLRHVDVRREWNHIDVLLVLTFADRTYWTVCIENKVKALQGPAQLSTYRSVVETAFPDAAQRLYIFLTKNEERPNDPAYRRASYDQVHAALTEAIATRSTTIAEQPRVLLENYLRLLEEKFMNQSDIASLALRIYQQHRRAIEVITAHTPDAIRGRVNAQVLARLNSQSRRLSVVVERFTDGIIRFTPVSWDVPQNRGFKNFYGNQRHVLLELKLHSEETTLNVCSGRSPTPWIDKVWEMAEKPPFNDRENWGGGWLCLHRITHPDLSFADSQLTDPNEMADAAFAWLNQILQREDTITVIRKIAQSLEKLTPNAAS